MYTTLPLRPNLSQYQKQAKELLRAARNGDPSAADRVTRYSRRDDGHVLADAQLAIAREHGIATWARFKQVIQFMEPFRKALEPGDPDEVARLLDQAPELANTAPWPSRPELHAIEGVSGGCVWHRPKKQQIADLLLASGSVCDITVAARAGFVERVAQLLDENPTLIDARDEHGRSALYRAGCVYGTFPDGERVVDLLLDRGAVMDFYVACTFGRVEDVRTALSTNPSLAGQADPDGMTGLHWAVRHRRCDGPTRHVAVTRLLLDAGADVGATNPQEEDMQAIHHCGEWGTYTAQLDLLIESGADINAVSGTGWTPLDYAIDRGRKGSIRSIKKRGGVTRAFV